MAKEEVKTLKVTLRELGDKDLTDYVVKRLLLTQMLSCVQVNLLDSIQRKLNASGKFRFEIKHNHNEIMRQVRKNAKHQDFFDKFSDETLDYYMGGFEALEDMILEWAGMLSSSAEGKQT